MVNLDMRCLPIAAEGPRLMQRASRDGTLRFNLKETAAARRNISKKDAREACQEKTDSACRSS
jgi:hypothetical protein